MLSIRTSIQNLKGLIEEIDRPRQGTKMRSVIDELFGVDFLQGTNALIIVLNDAISRLLRIEPNKIMPLGLHPTKPILQTISVEDGNLTVASKCVTNNIEDKGFRVQSIVSNTNNCNADEIKRTVPTPATKTTSNQNQLDSNIEGSLPPISTLSAQYNPFMVGFQSSSTSGSFNIASNPQLKPRRISSTTSNFPITIMNTIGNNTPKLPPSVPFDENALLNNNRGNLIKSKTAVNESSFQIHPPYTVYSDIVSNILKESRNPLQRNKTYEQVSSQLLIPTQSHDSSFHSISGPKAPKLANVDSTTVTLHTERSTHIHSGMTGLYFNENVKVKI